MRKSIKVTKNENLFGQVFYLVEIEGRAIHAERFRKDAEKVAKSIRKVFKNHLTR